MSRTAVLMYHVLSDTLRAPEVVPTRLLFEQVEGLLVGGWRVCSVAEYVLDPNYDGDTAILTFDDAYSGLAEPLLRLKADLGVSATVFVPTACVGRSNRWNPRSPYRLRHLTWRQCRDLLERSIDLQCHGHHHQSFLALSDDEIRRELAISLDLFRTRLDERPCALAYPYGHVDRRVASVAAEYFPVAFSAESGANELGLHGIPRLMVMPHLSAERLVGALLRRVAYLPVSLSGSAGTAGSE